VTPAISAKLAHLWMLAEHQHQGAVIQTVIDPQRREPGLERDIGYFARPEIAGVILRIDALADWLAGRPVEVIDRPVDDGEAFRLEYATRSPSL
jgi:hypothetical protein